MKISSRDENVGRISGFLYGISALNGAIREYEGCAYLIELDKRNPDIGKEINMHYEGQYKFRFSSVQKLKGGLGELEERVVKYLLPDIDIGTEEYRAKLGGYLAFRLIDMIDVGDIFDQFPLQATVTELQDHNASNEYTFFGIAANQLLLVFQFNKHDRSYHWT